MVRETEFERTIAEAWTTLFGVEDPGPDDDFFLAGGDSLAATRLASAIRLGTGRDVSVEDVFVGQTLGGIAARARLADPGTTLPTGSVAVLSSAQRRLWFVEQFVPDVPVHNVVMAERVRGRLDVAALESAFERVAAGQAALRWRLTPGDGVPTVTVADPAPVRIPVDDLSDLDALAQEPALRALLDAEVHALIDLAGGPLWRSRLVCLGDEDHIVVITVHHIIFDGWSQAILYRELGEAYHRALSGGQAEEPAPPEVTFADYTAWTLSQAKRDGPAATRWWAEHLAGAPTVLDLPRDRPRPAVLSFAGASCLTVADAELAGDVARLAMSEGATVGAVLLAAFSVVLRRLTGQHDLIVGVPMADRGHADFDDLIGFFIRVLALRLKVDDHAAFAEHVHRCRDELTAARVHADAPLERVVEALGVQRDLTRNPLFQVMFNVYNFAEAHLELASAAVEPWQVGVPGSLVDLTLYVIFRDGGIRLEAAYNCDLFDSARISALLDSYTHLLRVLVSHPARPVATASARPDGTNLPDWKPPLLSVIADGPGLLEQVRAAGFLAPDCVAVEEAGRTLSYRELLRLVDGTAATLRAAEVRSGDVVAVLAGRTAALPGVLLGILSTGARWAVLDCELPGSAVDRRLAAIGPRFLIRCCGGGATSRAPGQDVLVIDAAAASSQRQMLDAPASDRGYLSFTSGTTGEPKAIDSGEMPLVHFLNWYRKTFGLDRDARFAMLSGLPHDPLLRDMFTPLSCGGTLLVPAAELLKDPTGLLTWLADRSATVMHVTPQLVRMMAAVADGALALESLRLVAVGGDQLTEGDAAALRQIAPRARLLNFYGTTETPQAQAYFEIANAERAPDRDRLAALRSMPVPVGAGIDGAQLIVMSICGRPAAVGELGEVVVRSRYLSNGYLKPSMNGDRFEALPGAGDGRVYRTGDLGRYGPSGAVTLAGRSDDQVKIRGYRVELGEVENVLRSHPQVVLAAVRLFEHAGASALHAYAVTSPGPVSESALIEFARSQLPSWAVPASITLLAALPLTTAGKIDRSALPPPGRARYASGFSGDLPGDDLERLILGIWCEVLGASDVGLSDNFFEIGGNSMAIIDVQARLIQTLDRQVRVVDLFRFPTIRRQAEFLAGGQMDADLLASDLRGQTRRRRSGRRARPRTQES